MKTNVILEDAVTGKQHKVAIEAGAYTYRSAKWTTNDSPRWVALAIKPLSYYVRFVVDLNDDGTAPTREQIAATNDLYRAVDEILHIV